MKVRTFWTEIVLLTSFLTLGISASNGQSVPVKGGSATAEIKKNKCKKSKNNKADLVIDFLNLTPETAQEGELVSYKFSVSNDGKKPASVSTLAFYLSKDNQLDAEDILINSVVIDALNGSEQVWYDGDFVLPSGIPAGNYTLIAKADVADAVKEGNEINNLAFHPFVVNEKIILGDLRVTEFYLLSEWRRTYTYAGIVSNSYNSEMFNVEVAVYISKDSIVDPSDIVFQTTTIPSIAANDIGLFSVESTDIAILEAGDYYVIAKADFNNIIPEINEDNNTSFFGQGFSGYFYDLAPGIGYTFSEPTVPGDTVRYGYFTQLYGTRYLSSAEYGIYFSDNTVLDSSDVLVGTGNSGYFNSGDNPLLKEAVNDLYAIIPASATPGKYYLFFFVDYLNVYDETSETNNYNYQEIEIVAPASRLDNSSGNFGIKMTQAYPNPTDGRFFINLESAKQGEDGIADISIYDATGITIESRKVSVSESGSVYEFDLSGFSKGIYSVNVVMNGKMSSQKVVVK